MTLPLRQGASDRQVVDKINEAINYRLDATGTVDRPLSDKVAETISVKDFGADSSKTAAENTIAFQAALDHVDNVTRTTYNNGNTNIGYLGGGVVIIPASTSKYLINTIKVPVGVTLRGEGMKAVVLYSTVVGNAIEKQGQVDIYGDNHIAIENITLESDGVSATTAIELDTCDYPKVKNVNITKFATAGLNLKKVQFLESEHLFITDCGEAVILQNNSDGFGTNNCIFKDLRLIGNDTGIKILSGQANWIYGLTCMNHNNYGIYIDDSGASDFVVGVSIYGAHFEYNSINSAYDVYYNRGLNVSLYDAFFVVNQLDVERKVYTSGQNLYLINCYTQATNPKTVRSSRAIITSNGGDVTIQGGTYGQSDYSLSEIIADAADSESAAYPYLTADQWGFNGNTRTGRTTQLVGSTATAAYQVKVPGETYARLIISGNGDMYWGNGATADTVKLGVNGSVTGMSLSGAYISLRYLTTDTAIAVIIDGESVSRFSVLATGQMLWGDGTSYDVNLYRAAANRLATDDMLVTNTGLGVGNSAAATTLGSVTRKMEVFNASGVSLGFVPIYDTIT